jgi:hypothetical protein
MKQETSYQEEARGRGFGRRTVHFGETLSTKKARAKVQCAVHFLNLFPGADQVTGWC